MLKQNKTKNKSQYFKTSRQKGLKGVKINEAIKLVYEK